MTDGTEGRLASLFAGALLGSAVGARLGTPVRGFETEGLNHLLDSLVLMPEDQREQNRAVLGPLAGGAYPDGADARDRSDTTPAEPITDELRRMHAVAASLGAHAGLNDHDIAHVVSSSGNAAKATEPAPGSAVLWPVPLGLVYHTAGDEGALRQAVAASLALDVESARDAEGAQLLATAVAFAVRAGRAGDLDPYRFIDDLKQTLQATDGEYSSSCDAIFSLLWDQPDADEVAEILGNGPEAIFAVPAALYSFLAHYDSFPQALLFAVRLGGETDTIAALCGALAGAFHGLDAVPPPWMGGSAEELLEIESAHRLAARLTRK
jgi:ADP-ribosylglycohydrolase